MQCQVERGRPSFEPFIGDYYDDGVVRFECSAGHKCAQLVQSHRFEVLMESGATALLEGFTLEACASFSAALERFYEFALHVICMAQSISRELYAKMFAEMARQSERQLGAFMLIHAFEFGEPYKPNPKIAEIRNSVIHKGTIPTAEKAHEFISAVYSIIIDFYIKLHQKYPDQILSVRMQALLEKQASLPPDVKVSTTSGTIFFNGAFELQTDFAKALKTFRQARQRIAASIPELQALHDAERQAQS